MAISRRVTARFYKRARTASLAAASRPAERREESAVPNLPVTETRSGLVARQTPAQPTRIRPTHAPTTGSTRLSDYLRDARGRAEQILRDHPCSEGNGAATCQLCLLAYPCDAARAAEDVIAIGSKLDVGRLRSTKALLELMSDLVELGATDRGVRSDQAGPLTAEDHERPAGLTPH